MHRCIVQSIATAFLDLRFRLELNELFEKRECQS
jgi:hypothetical protein